MKKQIKILSKNFQFLVVKFSIYLNRRVFVMHTLRKHTYMKCVRFFFNSTTSDLGLHCLNRPVYPNN